MFHFYNENDTIAALATGKGNAALAIIRISGKNSFNVFSKCIMQKERFSSASVKTINIYTFFDENKKKAIDEITAIKYCSPKSYTGENMIEIICHGGELIIDEIITVLIKKGIRFAKKGEFTRRAFLNGKMDLLKAESIAQLIEGKSRRQITLAREQYNGNPKKKLIEWKDSIKNILVEIEASIEFPEEDDILKSKQKNIESLHDVLNAINEEIKKREILTISNKGIIIPIVGIANAGKSSLFNIIMEFDRVIVHHEEGTTRDAISEEIIMNGERVKIIDTAGLSTTDKAIELLGIKKTKDLIEQGDIILLVTPADKKITEEEISILKKEKDIIAIISKKDLCDKIDKSEHLNKEKIPYIEASFINEKDRSKIIEFIRTAIKKIYAIPNDCGGILCTKRHEEIARRIQKKLEKLLKNEEKRGEEIIAYELKGMIADFDEFIGETSNEEIIEAIFSEFCIGK